MPGDLDSTASARRVAPQRIPEPGTAGRLIYWLLPIRRRTILDNLRHVFGHGLDEREIRRLAQAHYTHLWRCFCEIARWWLDPTSLSFRIEVADSAWPYHPQKTGVLYLLAHIGNFELVPLVGLRSNPDFRGLFHVIRRPLPFRWLDRLVHSLFAAVGIGVIPDRGARRVVEETVRNGGSVAFVLDQHAGRRNGVVVHSLGQPAGTFRSLAEHSLALDRPVIPYLTWREPDGSHVVHFDDPIFPIRCADVEAAVRATTQAYNDVLDRFILEHPEQWFWVHRRWKASIPAHQHPGERARQELPARSDETATSSLHPGRAAAAVQSAPLKTATAYDSDPMKGA